MPNYRKGRINDEIIKEMAVILRQIKDPRVQKGLVSVTACDVSADLKFAKIYYSAVGPGADPAEIGGLRARKRLYPQPPRRLAQSAGYAGAYLLSRRFGRKRRPYHAAAQSDRPAR